MSARVLICRGDFGGDVGGTFGTVIFYCDADIFAVADFEIDIFSDNRVVAVSDNEELRPVL